MSSFVENLLEINKDGVIPTLSSFVTENCIWLQNAIGKSSIYNLNTGEKLLREYHGVFDISRGISETEAYPRSYKIVYWQDNEGCDQSCKINDISNDKSRVWNREDISSGIYKPANVKITFEHNGKDSYVYISDYFNEKESSQEYKRYHRVQICPDINIIIAQSVNNIGGKGIYPRGDIGDIIIDLYTKKEINFFPYIGASMYHLIVYDKQSNSEFYNVNWIHCDKQTILKQEEEIEAIIQKKKSIGFADYEKDTLITQMKLISIVKQVLESGKMALSEQEIKQREEEILKIKKKGNLNSITEEFNRVFRTK